MPESAFDKKPGQEPSYGERREQAARERQRRARMVELERERRQRAEQRLRSRTAHDARRR
jgi:hypothetical protein